MISVSWNDFHSPPCFLSSIKQIHEGLNKLFNPPGLEFQSHADAKEKIFPESWLSLRRAISNLLLEIATATGKKPIFFRK